MQGLKVTFATDPYDDLRQDQVEALQRQRVNEVLPLLVWNDLSFVFSIPYMRESDEDSPHVKFIVTTKCFWSDHASEIKKKLKNWRGVTLSSYACCEEPECYEEIAGKDLKYPLVNRRGDDGDEPAIIHLRCSEHLSARDLKLLETLETIEEQAGDRWKVVHVWPVWHRWIAQRVKQKWDRGDFRIGESWPYLVATPWIVGRTKELAIQAARDYEE